MEAGAGQVGERCAKIEPQGMVGGCVGSREVGPYLTVLKSEKVSNPLQAKQAESVRGFCPRITRGGSLIGKQMVVTSPGIPSIKK